MTNNDEQMAALREAIYKLAFENDQAYGYNGYNPMDEIMQLITTTQAEAVRDALADVAKVSQEHKHAKTYKSEPAYKAGYNAGYTKAWRSRGGLGDGTETPGGKVITLTNTKDAV